jgi:hypothetical protein
VNFLAMLLRYSVLPAIAPNPAHPNQRIQDTTTNREYQPHRDDTTRRAQMQAIFSEHLKKSVLSGRRACYNDRNGKVPDIP